MIRLNTLKKKKEQDAKGSDEITPSGEPSFSNQQITPDGN